jgi:ABC-type nitrate/sulfonate/bicarbonate transport system substrate-binding protein
MRGGLKISAIALVLLGAAASHAETLRVGKASPTSPAMLPADVGQAAGIFQKHGLELEISSFQGGGKLHQGTAAGAVDIGIGAGPEHASIAKGSPEIAIANPVGPPVFVGIIVPYDSPAHSLDDLRGKRIAITTVGSLTNWLALELARSKGWGPNGVTPIAIGSEYASHIAAFRLGTVDAAIDPVAFGYQMEEQKAGRLLASVASYVGNMSAATIFASNRMVHDNPDAIRRFLAGWFDAVAFMRANKAETVRITKGVTGYSQNVQEREYDLTISMFNDNGKFDAESIATLKRSFADLKLLDFTPDFSKLYTEEYLPKR